MEYNAFFEMTAVLFIIIVAVHFFTRRRFNTRLNRFYGVFLIIGMVDILADVVSTYTIADAAAFPLWLNITVNQILFLCQVALAPMVYLYIMCMTGAIDNKQNRRLIILTIVPAAICFVLVALNPLHRLFFYFDENLVYSHGPGFLGLYTETIFYLVASACVLVSFRRKLRRVEYLTMMTFIGIIIVTIVVQAILPQLLLTGVALSIAIVMMYLTMQNPDDMLDTLTGAFNRNSFFTYIDAQIRSRSRFQLAAFDVNGMGVINELFGIAVGDRLLAEIGSYLCELGGSNKLFRSVGNSFVLVTHGEQQCLNAVAAARERFKRRWSVGEISLEIGASVCYSLTADECGDANEVKTLINEGITAAAADRSGVFEVTREMHERVKRMDKVEALLRRSLDEGAVELYLQPLYSLYDGRVSGAEALARLRDEEGNIVMPGEFVPIAERTGLVTRLGEQMTDKGCRYLKESGLADDPYFGELSVNLSVLECTDDALAGKVCATVERYGIPPSKLRFEITETTATLSERLPETMSKLTELGFSFALDDFGTGYANYDSIMRLPFSAAKFDKSMLDISGESDKGERLLLRTMEMMRSLGFDVVVEGVETEAQARMLASRGVNHVQGFYFARPVPAGEFAELFNNLRDVKT